MREPLLFFPTHTDPVLVSEPTDSENIPPGDFPRTGKEDCQPDPNLTTPPFLLSVEIKTIANDFMRFQLQGFTGLDVV